MEWLKSKQARTSLSIVLIVTGWVLMVNNIGSTAAGSLARWPEEVLFPLGFIFAASGINFLSRARDDLETQKRRAAFRLPGGSAIVAITAFYIGLLMAQGWTDQSVHTLLWYMPIILVPAWLYYVAALFRFEARLKKPEQQQSTMPSSSLSPDPKVPTSDQDADNLVPRRRSGVDAKHEAPEPEKVVRRKTMGNKKKKGKHGRAKKA